MIEKCKHLWGSNVKQDVYFDIDTESYSVEGCCGGGCDVVVGIKYCPFCGEKLEKVKP